MNEAVELVLSALAGLTLGVVFYGGLWWTVRRGLVAKQPALWFLVSFMIRTGAVLTGFYLIGAGDWPRLLCCLLGFIAARFMITWMAPPILVSSSAARKESEHAA